MYVDNSVKRGDIFYADLSPVVGSEQGACVRCSSCRTTPETATAPLSSLRPSPPRPGRPGCPPISLSALSCGLPKDSIVLLEQIRTLDKRRLREHMGKLDEKAMKKGG